MNVVPNSNDFGPGREQTPVMTVLGGNLSPVTTAHSWGSETLCGVTSHVTLKKMRLDSRETLSRQVHVKEILYLILSGNGRLELGSTGEITHILSEGDVIHLPSGVIHQVIADEDGIIILVASKPETADITMVREIYGRQATLG